MQARSADRWAALSPPYRGRLVRQLGAGDTRRARAAYIKGASLKAARGKPDNESEMRRARGVRRGLTPSQAAGRPRAHEVPASAIGREFDGVPVRNGPEPDAGTQMANLTGLTFRQASTIGTYLKDVGELLDGRLRPGVFHRQWRGRKVARKRLEDRPDYVIELMRRQAPPPGQQRYRRTAATPRGGPA